MFWSANDHPQKVQHVEETTTLVKVLYEDLNEEKMVAELKIQQFVLLKMFI